jgi:Uncharacterized protein conserved in bacteria
MHRFYVAPEKWNPDALALTGPEAHHCRNVLRLDAGDKVVLFDGRGREVTAEITSADASEIRVRKIHERKFHRCGARSRSVRRFRKGKTWT